MICRCIPSHWPLWFGLLLPFAVSHAISWLLLVLSPIVFSPFVTQKCLHRDNTTTPFLPADVLAMACILFLFDAAWVLQAFALSGSETVIVALQSTFLASSTCLGVVSLLYFCFLQPRVWKILFRRRTNGSSEETTSPRSVDSTDHAKAFAMPTIVDESSVHESGMVNKTAYL